MKTKWIQLIAGITISVLCISVCPTTANAIVVWSDDFENGLEGWTLYGYENSSSQVMIDGDFSAISGVLEVVDDDVNIARIVSTVNVGSWIFDMYVPDGYYGAFYVQFLSNGTVSWAGATNNSHVSAGFFEDRFIVWREWGTSGSIIRDGIMDAVPGWHHVKVNRTSESHFEVCINGTLRASFDYSGITSSAYLQIYSNNATGCAIDNLIVSDDPGYTIPTPTTTPTDGTTPPPDGVMTTMLIIAGIGIAVVVIVLAIVFLRRR